MHPLRHRFGWVILFIAISVAIVAAALCWPTPAEGAADPSPPGLPGQMPAEVLPAGNKPAPAPKPKPQTPDDELRAAIGQAWSAFYSAGTAKSGKKLSDKDRVADYAKVASQAELLAKAAQPWASAEAAHILARSYWAMGTNASIGRANEVWMQMGKVKDESAMQRQQIASALQAAGTPDGDVEAIKLLDAVMKAPSVGTFKVEAAFELARLHESADRPQEALKALQAAERLINAAAGTSIPTWSAEPWQSLVKARIKGIAYRMDNARKDGLRSKFDIKAQFIVSMIADGGGGLWIGTEDHGVYHFAPDAEPDKQWRQFTRKSTGGPAETLGATLSTGTPAENALGDDYAYALAIDRLGRLWVGHLNHGVSVYNGKQWRNYDVINGPLGERIFDIQCCPTDGDVWMATSAGLARYSLAADAWSYFTRAEGLPEDQANTIAFDMQGNIYVGTQCHGIAIAQAANQYKTWRNVTAPDRFGPNNCSPVPLEPAGSGLPTNLINQIIVARDNTVWVATTTGLAWSRDAGQSWRYIRGRDYADKVKGLYGGAPKGWKAAPKELMRQLLPEDYITCIAEDPRGAIWLGTRRAGYVAIDPKTNARVHGTSESVGLDDNYVSVILPMPDGRPMVGSYIGGLIQPKEPLNLAGNKPARPIAAPTAAKVTAGKPTTAPADAAADGAIPLADAETPLPKPAAPPTVAELAGLQKRLESLKKPLPPVYAEFLGEDWTTQGDWVGRYGRHYAMLCAMGAPMDHPLSYGEGLFDVTGRLGPHVNGDDRLRHWVHWITTTNRRSLYNPRIGTRRQADWDDHGEAYSFTHDGPDLWIRVKVPEGIHRVSLYFFNKDGHSGNNRVRDYTMEVSKSAEDKGRPTVSEVLSRSRIKDFWGGVYKQLVVNGPCEYDIRVGRNYSFNTICSGVFLDHLAGPMLRTDGRSLLWMANLKYTPAEEAFNDPNIIRWPDEPEPAALVAARACVQKANSAVALSGSVLAMRKALLSSFRMVVSRHAGDELVGQLRWSLMIWRNMDRQRFADITKKAWFEMQRQNPHLRTKKWRPHSPNVFSTTQAWEDALGRDSQKATPN